MKMWDCDLCLGGKCADISCAGGKRCQAALCCPPIDEGATAEQWQEEINMMADEGAIGEMADELNRQLDRIDKLEDALKDAVAGLRYVRQHYHDERTASGDSYGVGFERVEEKYKALGFA